jgi:hypothetical protein
MYEGKALKQAQLQQIFERCPSAKLLNHKGIISWLSVQTGLIRENTEHTKFQFLSGLKVSLIMRM